MDSRITTEVCGHLAPGYLRAGVDRLVVGAVSPTLRQLGAAQPTDADVPFAAALLQGVAGITAS